MTLNKRVRALEQRIDTGNLLFPTFLLSGLDEPYQSFHDSGMMGNYCTMKEAGKAVLSGTIYELIQTKYKEYEKAINPN